jgi:hypothetical protein
VRTVAVQAISGKNRLDIAHEINRACGSRGQLGASLRRSQDSQRRAGKEFPETDCIWSQ